MAHSVSLYQPTRNRFAILHDTIPSNVCSKYLAIAYINGHTDNVGDFNANITLSKQRANAVVNELVTIYQIEADQLKAYGDGSTAPVAINSTKEGRAKNRRVEIVEQ